MPCYKTHLAAGFGTFIVFWPATSTIFKDSSYADIGICLGLSLLGSVFPDIDTKSKIQRLFYTLAPIPLLIFLLKAHWELFFITAFLCMVVGILQHRTITHRISFIALFPALIVLYIGHNHPPLFMVLTRFYIFFLTGAISHIVLDRSISKVKFFTQRIMLKK